MRDGVDESPVETEPVLLTGDTSTRHDSSIDYFMLSLQGGSTGTVNNEPVRDSVDESPVETEPVLLTGDTSTRHDSSTDYFMLSLQGAAQGQSTTSQ